MFHTTFCVHREGILIVHYFRIGEPGHQGHGAHHLVVDYVGFYLAGKVTADVLRVGGVPIAHLQRFGTKPIADNIYPAYHPIEVHDTYILAVRFECGSLFV